MSNEYYKSVVMAEEGSTKTIVNIPAWAQALHEGTGTQKDTINTPAAAYAYVPLIFRATRLVCNALVSAPVRFYKGTTEVDFPFPDVSLRNLLWYSQASMSLIGANYVEKIPRTKSKKVGGVKWINPTTMTVELVKSKDNQFLQFQQAKNTAKWTLDDMIYMREFTLRDDIQPGDSSAKVSLNDAALLRYMSRFAAYFFEGGAMPITLGSIEGLTDKDELKRVEGVFRRAVSGVKNAFRVLFVSKAIDVKTISQPMKDLAMPELANAARRSVADAFDMHPSLLDEAPNMATAKEHRLSLYEDSVKPRGDILAEEFNRQLFHPMGIEMKICFEEMDIFQEDEKEKADSVETLTRAISTDPEVAEFVMDFMGYDFQEKQLSKLRALIEERKKKPESGDTEGTDGALAADGENVQQQALNGAQVESLISILTLVVEGTLPRESGIEVIIASFPIDRAEAERMMGEIGKGFKPEQVVQPTPPQGTEEEAPVEQEPPAKAVYADDLARWERKALRVFKESKSAVCTFESEIIPVELRAAIERGLVQCATADSVRALFNRIEPVKATQTAQPEYKAETYALAESINELAAAYLKAQAVTPPPNINVTLPQITMTAQIPETKEASITFSPVFSPNIQPSDVAVQNTVNLPDQPAPQVTNEITVQPADVKMPKPKRERQKVKRDKKGFISETNTEIEYEE